MATFSLTNSVPQDPCFNRIVWYEIESDTKARFIKECSFKDANRHVITGAVPSKGEFIPQKDVLVDDNPDKVPERVNVPEYSWTMACCDASESGDAGISYFEGVIGQNRAGGIVEKFTDVRQMEKRLSEIYGYGTQITLLVDSCSPNSTKPVFG